MRSRWWRTAAVIAMMSALAWPQSETIRPAREMGSPSVPLDSWVYPAFDRLIAKGYVRTGYLDLRPWTRMECMRLISEVQDDIDDGLVSGHDPEAAALVAALAAEFQDERERIVTGRNRGAGIDSVYVRAGGTSGAPLTDALHFGSTRINDFGRPFGAGADAVVGWTSHAVSGPFLLSVQGEFQHGPAPTRFPDSVRGAIALTDVLPVAPSPSAGAIDRFRLIEAKVAWQWRGTEFSFGKQSLWWGPGEGSAMLMSDNAEPIPMLRISRTEPGHWPWIFRKMGPVRTEMFVGTLSGHVQPARPLIHGEKVSFKPTPNLEMGFSRTVIFGGVGHPLTPLLWYRSYFSIGIGDNASSDLVRNDPGDRRGGFDFTYRVPRLRRWLTIYADGMSDDDQIPLVSPSRSAWNAGIYLPQLPHLPKMDFRAEAVYTDVPGMSAKERGGHFAYWNGVYRDSYTNRGQLMATWVGRDGRGLQLWSTYWLSAVNRVQVSYRQQTVDREFLQGGNLRDLSARADFRIRKHYEVGAFLQYERWRFPALAPGPQQNLTVQVQFTYRPPRKAFTGSAPASVAP